MRAFLFLILLYSLVSCILSQDTCLDGVTIEKTQTWSTGYIGKLILDQSWLQQHKSTSDWTLDLGFCSEVTEFKVWSASIVNPSTSSNKVNNVGNVTVSNVCWNNILYPCQNMELLFLVRHPSTNTSCPENGGTSDPAAYNVQSVSESVTYNDGSSGSSEYCPVSCMSSTSTTTTTTTSTTTTTTTTSPYLENVSLRIYARDSINNDPVPLTLVNVTLVKPGGGLHIVAVNLELNSKGFNTINPLPANGEYEVSLMKDGYIEKLTNINVNATMDGEMVTKYIIMVPNLHPGESTIVMSWETTPPQDMDIHVAAIKNSDNSICIVNFDNRQCTDAAISQTRDNAAGGNNGPETVQLQNAAINSQYTYLLAAEDYEFENNGDSLLESCTSFSIQNNVQGYDFPKLEGTAVNITNEFYFFGCLTVATDGEYTAIDAPQGIFFNGLDNSQWQNLKNTYC